MIYRFADFELDPERRELRRAGEHVPVEPQVLDLLTLLVTNHQRMVSKEEIIERIWQGRFVSDAAISGRVKSARQAVGDDGREQAMIRTVHRRGFRFVGEVSAEWSNATQPVPSSANPDESKNSSQPMIAVLSFVNQSSDPERAYFAEAITQDLTNNLSQYRWLKVLARNQLRRVEQAADAIDQLRAQLGVDYLVAGTVRWAGNRIRVTAELVDTETGSNLWAERYERELKDVFEVQDQITSMIAARLEPEIGLAERQRVARHHPQDLRAWDCYHLGISHFYRFTAEDNQQALQLFERSRALDPAFGEAHAWWAYATILGMVYWDLEPSQQNLDDALEAASTALALDDRNAVFYALKARVQLARREYASALKENQIAISLNPTLSAAHCGLADSLLYDARYDEAIDRFEHVIELSTNDPQRWAFFTYGALAMIFKGDYSKALTWCNQALEIPNRQYWTLAHKMVALAYLGLDEEMRKARQQLLVEKSEFSAAFARDKLFYIDRPEQLERYLNGLEKAGFSLDGGA